MSKARSALRRSAGDWASLVAACERSGLSRAAFAEREGIHPGTFSFWASRLAPKHGKRLAAVDARAGSSFVPVRVRARDASTDRAVVGGGGIARSKPAAAAAPNATSADTIEIALANGRCVRCALSQAGDPRLAALLTLVEGGRSC